MVKNRLSCIIIRYTKERQFFVFDNDTKKDARMETGRTGITLHKNHRTICDTAGRDVTLSNRDIKYFNGANNVLLNEIFGVK